MSSDTAELDGLWPLVDGFGGVAVDVIDVSVVVVAAYVAAVDTTTTVDFTVRVLTVAELVILVVTAGRYGSVTSIDFVVPAITVDVASVAMSVDASDAAASVDDVNVAFFLDGVVVGAVSDASSEMTIASWKSASISGMSCVVVDTGVANCYSRAASSAAVSSDSTSGNSMTGCSASKSIT